MKKSINPYRQNEHNTSNMVTVPQQLVQGRRKLQEKGAGELGGNQLQTGRATERNGD